MVRFKKNIKADTVLFRSPALNNYTEPPMTNWGRETKFEKRCQCCSTVRPLVQYPPIQDTFMGFTDEKGIVRFPICKLCLQAIADKFTQDDPDHNKYKALYRLCAITNLYYDDDVAHEILDGPLFFEDESPLQDDLNRVPLYFKYIVDTEKYKDKTFLNSDNLDMKDVLKRQRDLTPLEELSDEDRENRLMIIKTFHRDIFENEPLEERKILMSDLCTMIDYSMADKFVRQQAAIEIVRTFRRINKISEALQELQKTPELTAQNSKTIKELVSEKKQETDMVTAFSKDHGFAEKYALAKSKGSGTLGAIVRDMTEKGYDRGAINRFDIETANAMKQVSDLSAESIMKQISLTDSEYAQMVKEQAVIIRKMQETMEKQAEELRTLKEKHLKQELLEELRRDLSEKGINSAEVEELVKKEMEHRTQFSYEEGV